jgi:hypothetical protein
MFLGLDRLLEDGIAAAVLLAHGLGGGFHVRECFWLYGCNVGDDGVSIAVYFEDRITAWTGHFEVCWSLFRHFSE